ERLVIAEVAIREPVHHAVGERVELLRRARLRHAGASVAQLAVTRDGDRDRAGKRRVRGVREVDVELPEGKARRVIECHEIVGRSRWRQGPSVERRRKKSAIEERKVEYLRGGGGAGEHPLSVECP